MNFLAWNIHVAKYPRAFLVAQSVKNLPAVQKTRVRSLSWEDPLEKEMATHSSIFAWEVSWTEEPGGLQSMGLQRVRHDWATNTYLLIHVAASWSNILLIHIYWGPTMCLIVLEDTEKSSRTLSLSREPLYSSKIISGLPWWLSGKESACQCRKPRVSPWVGKIPSRSNWQRIPVFLPGKSHGPRSVPGYST